MLNLLKVFGRGIVTTVLLPFILIIWIFYGVYCIGLFIVMFIKSVIDYFLGKSFSADLPEDYEARRMLLEKDKTEEDAKKMLSSMYQTATLQTKVVTPAEAEESYQQSSPFPAPSKPSFMDEVINKQSDSFEDTTNNNNFEEPSDDIRSN